VTLHQFAIFAAIGKHRNLTNASQELHITQPGISHQMRLLEEEYGVKLYTRAARGVELTDAGRHFLVAITPILEQVRTLKPASLTVSARDPERLAIGGTHSLSRVLLPSILSRYKQSRPAMEIDFRTNNATEIERLILNQSIEIALTTRPPKSPLIVAEPFRRQRVGFVVSRHHRLATARAISLRDLERTPLLVRSTGGHDGTIINQLKNLLEQRGIKVTISMRFESVSAMMEAVRRNMGIAVTYEDNVRHDEVKIVNVRGLKLQGQSQIIYLNLKPLSKPAAEFLELLRNSRAEKDKTEHQLSGTRRFNSIGFALCFSAHLSIDTVSLFFL
jgi:DNA-binding transcriptional LysR family regulator